MGKNKIDKKFRSKLLEEIGPIFNQYVMDGEASIASFTQVNMNIDDLETVLKVHYLMPYQTPEEEEEKLDVIDFMKTVKKRIREINTIIKKEKERFQGGEVKGKIDFSGTFKERMMNNPFDETLFICNIIDRSFDNDENKVLKAFLEVVWEILNSDMIEDKLEYEYLKKYWIDKKDIGGDKVSFKGLLGNLLKNNIYLRNIKVDKEKIIRDNRLLNDVSKSRNKLYSEAAELLKRYKKVVINKDINPSEAKELLRHTFIKPNSMDLLFELYWALRIIDEVSDENPNLKTIHKKANLIAYWEKDDYNYKLYHRCSGRGKIGINFKESGKEILKVLEKSDVDINGKKITDTFIGRELKIMKYFEELNDNTKLWGGNQPDIILEKICKDTDETEKIFVGEVKYSQEEEYDAKTGMKELLEYMSLIGNEEDYFENQEDLFQGLSKVNGALFIKENAKVGKITDNETKSEHIQIIHHNREEGWDDLKEMLDL